MQDYYNTVKQILVDIPETRDDDMKLYGAFCARYDYALADGNFYEVLSTARERKLPCYESITRARRKVQELEPSLRGVRHKSRKAKEEEYREFYSPIKEVLGDYKFE